MTDYDVMAMELVGELQKMDDADEEDWENLFRCNILEIIRLKDWYLLPKRGQLALAVTIVGARSLAHFNLAFRILCDWSIVGGCFWVAQLELLRHAAMYLIRTSLTGPEQTAFAPIALKNDIVAMMPIESPDHVTHSLLRTKLTVLRDDLLWLLDYMADSNRPYEVYVEYYSQYGLSKFIPWFLRWGFGLLEESALYFPPIGQYAWKLRHAGPGRTSSEVDVEVDSERTIDDGAEETSDTSTTAEDLDLVITGDAGEQERGLDDLADTGEEPRQGEGNHRIAPKRKRQHSQLEDQGGEDAGVPVDVPEETGDCWDHTRRQLRKRTHTSSHVSVAVHSHLAQLVALPQPASPANSVHSGSVYEAAYSDNVVSRIRPRRPLRELTAVPNAAPKAVQGDVVDANAETGDDYWYDENLCDNLIAAPSSKGPVPIFTTAIMSSAHQPPALPALPAVGGRRATAQDALRAMTSAHEVPMVSPLERICPAATTGTRTGAASTSSPQLRIVTDPAELHAMTVRNTMPAHTSDPAVDQRSSGTGITAYEKPTDAAGSGDAVVAGSVSEEMEVSQADPDALPPSRSTHNVPILRASITSKMADRKQDYRVDKVSVLDIQTTSVPALASVPAGSGMLGQLAQSVWELFSPNAERGTQELDSQDFTQDNTPEQGFYSLEKMLVDIQEDDSVASDVTLSKPPIASAKPIQHSHKQSRSELSSVHSNAADSLAYSSSTSAFTSFTGLEGTRVF